MKTTFIYVLKDPETLEVRYVGKSNRPSERLLRHKRDCRLGRFYQHRWVASLLSKGQSPVLEILDQVSVEEWPQWEAAYILFFRERGCRLTNTTEGGECGPDMTGRTATSEARQNMAKAKKGVPWSEERRAAKRGRTYPPEWRAAISAAKKGKKFTQAHCEALRQAQTGTIRSPEVKNRMREAQQARRKREVLHVA